ncbi:MAG: Hpt domain-containing protein [Breznakibacter sp.]|nr:Hpt domain-containing protein [Breznakibacter sp.]
MKTDYQIIDLSYLNEISDNNSEIKRALIDIFLSQIPEFESDFQRAFAEKNWKFLAQVAHKAKSSVLSMGMNNLGSVDLKNLELLSNKFYINILESNPHLTDKEKLDLENLKATLNSYPTDRIKWIEENISENNIENLIKKFVEICNKASLELNCELNELQY